MRANEKYIATSLGEIPKNEAGERGVQDGKGTDEGNKDSIQETT